MRYGHFLGLAVSAFLVVAPLNQCTNPPPGPPTGSDCTSPLDPTLNLVANGDFNENYVDQSDPGTPAIVPQRKFAPAPWIQFGSTDYSTEDQINFNGSNYNRTSLAGFLASPAGGSFIGFRSFYDPDANNEGVVGSIQVDDPTQELSVFFYYTEYSELLPPGFDGKQIPVLNPDVNIEFKFGVDAQAVDPSETGVKISSIENLSATDGIAGNWQVRTLTFTPSDIGFAVAGNYDFFLGAKDSATFQFGFADGLIITTESLCDDANPPANTTSTTQSGGTTTLVGGTSTTTVVTVPTPTTVGPSTTGPATTTIPGSSTTVAPTTTGPTTTGPATTVPATNTTRGPDGTN